MIPTSTQCNVKAIPSLERSSYPTASASLSKKALVGSLTVLTLYGHNQEQNDKPQFRKSRWITSGSRIRQSHSQKRLDENSILSNSFSVNCKLISITPQKGKFIGWITPAGIPRSLWHFSLKFHADSFKKLSKICGKTESARLWNFFHKLFVSERSEAHKKFVQKICGYRRHFFNGKLAMAFSISVVAWYLQYVLKTPRPPALEKAGWAIIKVKASPATFHKI